MRLTDIGMGFELRQPRRRIDTAKTTRSAIPDDRDRLTKLPTLATLAKLV